MLADAGGSWNLPTFWGCHGVYRWLTACPPLPISFFKMFYFTTTMSSKGYLAAAWLTFNNRYIAKETHSPFFVMYSETTLRLHSVGCVFSRYLLPSTYAFEQYLSRLHIQSCFRSSLCYERFPKHLICPAFLSCEYLSPRSLPITRDEGKKFKLP